MQCKELEGDKMDPTQYMWNLAFHLVKVTEFSFIEEKKLENGNSELSFLKNEGRDFIYLRIVLSNNINYEDWKEDYLNFISNMENLRRRTMAKSLKAVTVYITEGFNHNITISTLALKKAKDRRIDLSIGLVDLIFHEVDVRNWRIFEITYLTLQNLLNEYRIINDTEWLKEQIMKIEEKRKENNKQITSYGETRVVYSLMAINILVFLILSIYGGSTNSNTLILFGAKVNFLIERGEYWRLITPIFLHIGFAHLLFNTLALYYLGRLVEGIYGSIRFTFIYLIAGLTGNIASFLLSPHLSAGASGAIFGLFGALLYFGYHHRNFFYRTIGMEIITLLIINLALGFVYLGIDQYAHLGGLIGGGLASLLIGLPTKQKSF